MVGLLDVFDQLIQTPLKINCGAGKWEEREGGTYTHVTWKREGAPGRNAKGWGRRTNLCRRWPTPRGPARRV